MSCSNTRATRQLASAIAIATFMMVTIVPGNVVAQEATTGAIEGQAIDAQGLAIPGATVLVTGVQGTKTFVTDTEGRFLAPFLTPGVHTVTRRAARISAGHD